MSSRWVIICLCYICSRRWSWGWWDVIQQCPWLQDVLWSVTFPVPKIVVNLTFGVNYRRVSNICPFFDTGPAFWRNIFFPLLFTHKYFIPPYLMQISLNRKKAREKKMFLHVLHCCFIFYLHLKKKFCHFLWPNFHLFPFFPSLTLPHTSPVKISLFWIASFFCFPSDKTAQEKGKSKVFCRFLLAI